MKISELVEQMEFEVISSGVSGMKNEVEGVYCCDLLSWVMSHGEKHDAWITVQIHPNVIAVASLLEFSCIIIPEEIQVEDVTIEKSISENIPILQSKLSAYEICKKLGKLGL